MGSRAADQSRDQVKKGHCWASLGYPTLQLHEGYRRGGMPNCQFTSHKCARERPRCVFREIIAPDELRLAGIQGLGRESSFPIAGRETGAEAFPGSLPRPPCRWCLEMDVDCGTVRLVLWAVK